MILYKYLQAARLDILENRTIRFTQPSDLNDPFECRPNLVSIASGEEIKSQWEAQFAQGLDEQLGTLGPLPNGITKDDLRKQVLEQKDACAPLMSILERVAVSQIAPKFIEGFDQHIGILCLSEVRDAQLMWSHYADSHRGHLIGFDAKHPFFQKRRGPNDEFGFLRKVEYTARRPQVTLTHTLSAEWFHTKHQGWAYEKEWRMMRVLGEADRQIPVQPFPICLFEFPPEAVVEIVFGMRCPQDVRARIEGLAHRFPRVRTLAVREGHDYDLIVEPVR